MFGFFFFKQKTAYEMRISDWSSDVCSSDLTLALRDAILAGKVQGPRIVDAGASISGSAGHMDGSLGYRDELRPFFAVAGNTCNGADDCRRAVRPQIGRGADVIKFASPGGVTSRHGAGPGTQWFARLQQR